MPLPHRPIPPLHRWLCAGLLAAASLSLACGPPPAPQGPRPTGVSSRAFVGEAELQLRYRYEPTGARSIELLIDGSSSSGQVGQVQIELGLDGFEQQGPGPLSWTLDVPGGQTVTQKVSLLAVKDTPSATVTTTRTEGRAELARDTLRFIVDVEEGLVRECRPTDAACATP